VDLLDPVLDVVKGGGLVDCVGEDDYQRPLVEGSRKVLELLLPRSVPNLQLYFQLFDLQRFYLKVDTDRRGIRRFETVVAVAEQNVGFPDSAVAYDNRFHHKIAVCLFLWLHKYMKYQTLGSTQKNIR
jgi:hypothetical protein